MKLIRRDKSFTGDPENPLHWEEEFGFEKIEDGEMSEVRVDFEDFGRGQKKRPGFAVKVSWLDVRNYVAAFIEMEHPDALYLQRLIKLAEAIEGAGWSPEDPPEEGFHDILPQSN
jgi:hypothetical protein